MAKLKLLKQPVKTACKFIWSITLYGLPLFIYLHYSHWDTNVALFFSGSFRNLISVTLHILSGVIHGILWVKDDMERALSFYFTAEMPWGNRGECISPVRYLPFKSWSFLHYYSIEERVSFIKMVLGSRDTELCLLGTKCLCAHKIVLSVLVYFANLLFRYSMDSLMS